MTDDHISINLWLAGRSYRIRILPHEEEAVRKAAKVADEKIQELRNHYAGKDDQDFIAMCLLMYATDNAIEMTSTPMLQSQVAEMIGKIDQVINK